MQTVLPGVHASAPQALSFAKSLHVRTFLLQREQGNLLVYGTAKVADEVLAIADFGGAVRHYLNHWHEADVAGQDALGALGAPLFCHDADLPEVARTHAAAGTFAARHMAGDDFEVIPIPGHTPGATAYLWDSGRHRCLFTGDSVYLREGEWVAAVLEFERSCRLHRKPRAHQGARFRRARPLGGERRPALPCRHRQGRRPAPHRCDPRARAPGRRPLRPALGAADRRACAGAGKGTAQLLCLIATSRRSRPDPVSLGELLRLHRRGVAVLPHVPDEGARSR